MAIEAALAYIGIRVTLNNGKTISGAKVDDHGAFGAKATKARNEKRKTLLASCRSGSDIVAALRSMIPVVVVHVGGFPWEKSNLFAESFPAVCDKLPSIDSIDKVASVEVIMRTFEGDFPAWRVDEAFFDFFEADSIDVAYGEWIESGWDATWIPRNGSVDFETFGSVKSRL